MTSSFSHRACYVNFAEHLQNAWNPNLYFPAAPNQWSDEDWRAFFRMIRAFGFNVFEYWIPPTLMDRPALAGAPVPAAFAKRMREVTGFAHDAGLKVKVLVTVNTIGPQWYFACPNDPADRKLILELWRHWLAALPETDIVGIFPGDPGGCNRNGCTHETFVDLALELCGLIKSQVEIGTWGTPFTGWGDDLISPPGWDGSFRQLLDQKLPGGAFAHIWNGGPDRARRAMEYFLKRLPAFPDSALVAINLGFSPDGDATMGGDARPWAREIARHRPIVTWDYSVSEGELVLYPHWRLPRLAARRREERAAAPYIGGMNYTMSPRLNYLTLYAAGQLFLDPTADPDELAARFCAQVFGDPALGTLLEAFEVVPGWGHYPRRKWSRFALRAAYREIVDRLAAATVTTALVPDAERYRQDLLWFARQFLALAGESPDRAAIKREYWRGTFAIYDHIPMSVDERADQAATKFSQLLAEESKTEVTL
jgi:hypothetical protein